MAPDHTTILPRVLIVSRRTIRKNKFVDFVGEYHLDLIVSYGGAPVIVPRVNGIHNLLDIESELSKKLSPTQNAVVHMDYENYDGHRHMINVVKDTPLHQWFKGSMNSEMEMSVNSYHHQGVRRLAERFAPMAFAPDGLIEGFYDPNEYSPEEGKFMVGLQFHPERMRVQGTGGFQYPGCAFAYRDFVRAVRAYGRKMNDPVFYSEKKRKGPILRSFSIPRNVLSSWRERIPVKEYELEAGYELEDDLARVMIQKMSIEQLSDMASFYNKMGLICSEAIEIKIQSPLL